MGGQTFETKCHVFGSQTAQGRSQSKHFHKRVVNAEVWSPTKIGVQIAQDMLPIENPGHANRAGQL